MFSRNHGKPHTETYRFSATPTLSDFPLLIGEMLRLSDLRAKRQASRRSLFQRISSAPGFEPGQTAGCLFRLGSFSPTPVVYLVSRAPIAGVTRELTKHSRQLPLARIGDDAPKSPAREAVSSWRNLEVEMGSTSRSIPSTRPRWTFAYSTQLNRRRKRCAFA